MLTSAATNAVFAFQDSLKEQPLAAATLWHRELPRTSQRRALQDLGPLVTLILGGNRSGKSEALAQFEVATALGRKSKTARIWCHLNGIPLEYLPNRPGKVWAVALDSGDSREYVRPKVAKYLPLGCKWRNREGTGRAEVRLPGGGRILFPSVAEGRDGFQGTYADLIGFDEEPEDQSVVNEAMMRLVDTGGRMVFAMTPLRGMSWVYDRWVAETPPDCRVHWIHGPDNPHLPPGGLERMLAQFGPHERAARERGEFTTLEGRVYQDWRRGLHVVQDVPVQPDWIRYASIDFGTRNPFCCLMAVVDPKDDTLYILDEHYQREWTLKKHAKAMRKMFDEYGHPEQIVADPEDRGSRLSLAADHNMPTVKARKEIRAGINTVAERLSPDAQGHAHLFVHARCKHLIREIEGYIWDKRKTAGGERDAPKKANDHAMDALRYLCRYLQRSTFDVG